MAEKKNGQVVSIVEGCENIDGEYCNVIEVSFNDGLRAVLIMSDRCPRISNILIEALDSERDWAY